MSTAQPVGNDRWERLADSLRHDAPSGQGVGLESRFTGLQRPECVLTHSSGSLFVSDKRGGVLQLRPDGSQHLMAGPGLPVSGCCR